MKNHPSHPRAMALALLAVISSVTVLPGRAGADDASLSVRKEQEMLARHAIIVDGHGSAMRPVVRHQDGKLVYTAERMKSEKTDRKEFKGYLEEMFESIRRHAAGNKKARIVVYIHGGMNWLKDSGPIPGSIQKAAHLARYFEEREPDTYVVSICWQSDPLATLADHLFVVQNGLHDPLLATLSLPITLVADIGEIVIRSPIAFFKLFGNDVLSASQQFDERYQRAAEIQRAALENKRDAARTSMGGDSKSRLASTGDIIGWAAAKPLTIGTGAVIEGLGKRCWQMMLRRSRTMFVRESRFRDTRGAVGMFFDEASQAVARRGAPMPEMTIIGHSMGTIVICNALTGPARNLRFDNIVFLAAACTGREFHAAVVPYLDGWRTKGKKVPRFYNLCLDPNAERSEKTVAVGGSVEFTPRGSLLIWLDSILDRPASEQDRMFGRWDNAVLVMKDAPKALQPSLFLKTFGRDRVAGEARAFNPPFAASTVIPASPVFYTTTKNPGKRRELAEPTKHADFTRFNPENEGDAKKPNFAFWREEFWAPEEFQSAASR